MSTTMHRRPQVPSTRPPAMCPTHPGMGLEEGPVHYRCPRGHRVQAADLNREVTR